MQAALGCRNGLCYSYHNSLPQDLKDEIIRRDFPQSAEKVMAWSRLPLRERPWVSITNGVKHAVIRAPVGSPPSMSQLDGDCLEWLVCWCPTVELANEIASHNPAF